MASVPAPFVGLDLPDSVLNAVKNRPAEDVALAILRRGLPGMPIYALIPKSTPDSFIVVRDVPELGNPQEVPGLLHQADFTVHCYAQDPEGDEKAALIGDAVVTIMDRAFREHWVLKDPQGNDIGSVNKIWCQQYPAREPDWATSSGPVQYADLPTGDWRYEARFRARINTPRVLAD